MKIERLKGFIGAVSAIQTLPGEKATPIQYLVLAVAAYTDTFGEKKGRDQQWLLQVIGEKQIEKLKLSKDLEGSKAAVTFYAESFELPAREPGSNPFFVVNNTLAEIEIIP